MPFSNLPSAIKDIQKISDGKMSLKEENVNTRLSEVKVLGLNEQHTFLFQIDGSLPLSHYLADGKIRKRCDYVLFSKFRQSIFIIFIEMKSQRSKKQDIIEKFKCSNCYISYIACLLKELFDDNRMMGINRRYILFHTNSTLNKRKTLPQKISDHCNPDSYKKIRYTHPISFKQLAGIYD